MTQKKKSVVTSKTVKPKKKQPPMVEIELQRNQEELELINKELAQSRAELETALGQYTDLYDFAPVGYFTLTRNGTIQQVNLAGANLLGMEHNEATRIRLAAFVSSESRPVFNIFFEKLLSGEGKETCELAFEKKGNRLLWARLEATCFEGGDVCRAMLTDITERKRMEQALLESENRFRILLQDVSTIAVQGYAIDGTTQYWNSASERLYGYSAREALGQSLLDLIIPPEMQDGVTQAIQQMAEIGQPIPAAELSLMRKDGSRVAVYSSHAIVSVPGRAPEFFCLDVDLTEHKRISSLLQARVRISEFAESHTFDELLQKTLDEAEALTGSQIGFAHFLEADQKTLHLQMWSTNTLKNMCNAEGKGEHYPVDQAGVWADCVSTRAPLVHNDYPNLPVSRRKGLPEGHAPVLREIVVPVLHNDLIVMIMGVGNKSTDYDDNDLETLSQLANLTWDVIQRKRAEDLLKESEWRNRIVSELTADYIFVVDVDPGGILKLRWASDNMYRMTGRTVEEAAMSDGWARIIHPDDQVRFFGFINQILSTAEEGELECRTFYKSGAERWIHIFARPQISEGNSVTTIIGAIQDITESKQAEEALRESEDKFKYVFDNSVVGKSITFLTGEINANQALCDMLGYAQAELQSRKWQEITHPDDIELTQREIDQLFSGEQSSARFNKRFIHKNGSVVWVDLSSSLRRDKDGKPLYLISSISDITERKQAEDALRVSEEKYRTVANFTYDWETWLGPDGVYRYVSPSCERITGHKAAEFLADSNLIVKIAHPDDQPKVTEHFEVSSSQAKGQDLHFDFQIITPEGKTRWISHYCMAVYGEDGQWLGRRESNRDITERKQAEVELEYMKEGLKSANIELQTALAREKKLAHTDSLTGINNRRRLYELAEHEFEIATRYQQPLSVIMFDIDHFKQVNDTFRHAIGDQILQRVTQVACAELRSADVIGRYGGEEFVIMLPMTNARQAYPLAERIRAGVSTIHVTTEKGDAVVTLSLGIVEMTHGSQIGSAEELIRRADKAMYAAKQAGRNRTEIGD